MEVAPIQYTGQKTVSRITPVNIRFSIKFGKFDTFFGGKVKVLELHMENSICLVVFFFESFPL